MFLVAQQSAGELDAFGWFFFILFALGWLALFAMCILKGRIWMAIVGIFIIILIPIGALMSAKPNSWWARRYSPPGGPVP